MTKFISAVALFFSVLIFSQQTPIRQIYAYGNGNDKSLVKAKTDLFLLNVLSSGKIKMETISSGDDFLDIYLLTPIAEGNISSRVRYDFMKEGYVVSLSNTKIIGKNGKTVPVNITSDKNHQKIIDAISNLVFDTYTKEMTK